MKSEQGEGDNMAGGGSVVKCQSQTMAYLRTELYLDLRANIRHKTLENLPAYGTIQNILTMFIPSSRTWPRQMVYLICHMPPSPLPI